MPDLLFLNTTQLQAPWNRAVWNGARLVTPSVRLIRLRGYWHLKYGDGCIFNLFWPVATVTSKQAISQLTIGQ